MLCPGSNRGRHSISNRRWPFLRSEAYYRFLSHLPWDKPSVAWAGPVPRRKNSPDRPHRLVQTMKQMPPPQRTCYSSGHQWDNHRGWRCLRVLLGNFCFRVGRLIKMSCGSFGCIWSENDVADWLLCVCVCVCVCVCCVTDRVERFTKAQLWTQISTTKWLIRPSSSLRIFLCLYFFLPVNLTLFFLVLCGHLPRASAFTSHQPPAYTPLSLVSVLPSDSTSLSNWALPCTSAE